MTEIVVKMIRSVNLGISRVHNDSTTIKAYGKIPGTTKNGLKLANDKSKNGRPDLAQLVFSLTISSDGAVPIHYKTYPGNRTDDTTHIETWNIVREIAGTNNFTYVADCKVCNTWKESKIFKNSLFSKKIAKR